MRSRKPKPPQFPGIRLTPHVHVLPPDETFFPALPLERRIRSAVAAVAPERADEIEALIARHGIIMNFYAPKRVVDDLATAFAVDLKDLIPAREQALYDGFYVSTDVLTKEIMLGWSAVERMWAYAVAYASLLSVADLIRTRRFREEHAAGVAVALFLIRWAGECELRRQQLPWPAELPRPADTFPHGTVLWHAVVMFQMMIGWSLLHEIGHVVCEHPPTLSSARQGVREEYQADEWATRWMIPSRRSFYGGRERNFATRALGITMALSVLSGMEAFRLTTDVRFYPDPAHRLYRFLKRHIPAPDAHVPHLMRAVWLDAAIVLSAHLQVAGARTDQPLTEAYAFFESLPTTLDLAAARVHHVATAGKRKKPPSAK